MRSDIGIDNLPRLAFVIRSLLVKHTFLRLRTGPVRGEPIRWQWRTAINLLLTYHAGLPSHRESPLASTGLASSPMTLVSLLPLNGSYQNGMEPSKYDFPSSFAIPGQKGAHAHVFTLGCTGPTNTTLRCSLY